MAKHMHLRARQSIWRNKATPQHSGFVSNAYCQLEKIGLSRSICSAGQLGQRKVHSFTADHSKRIYLRTASDFLAVAVALASLGVEAGSALRKFAPESSSMLRNAFSVEVPRTRTRRL